MNCVVCDAQLPAPASAGRPRRYCSTACRQRAYHARHAAEQPVLPPQAANGPDDWCLTAEPLLAAIVFVPVDEDGHVFAAHSFGEFPWQALVDDLRECRESRSPADPDIS